MKKAVLLRVGIDSGCGGIQSPLFSDGSFEFVCIPDNKRVSDQKYGTVIGKNGRPHSAYFPARKQAAIAEQHIHLDPEFETFSRLLTKAHRLSSVGKVRSGKPLKVLSPEMRKVFGTFDGRVSIQRSPPRWVEAAFVEAAIKFVTTLK